MAAYCTKTDGVIDCKELMVENSVICDVISPVKSSYSSADSLKVRILISVTLVHQMEPKRGLQVSS